jgi:hypothetical protein
MFLYGPTSVLELYIKYDRKCPSFNNLYVQNACQIAACVQLFYISIKEKMYFSEIHICVCLWEIEERKIYLKLEPGISKSKRLWFYGDM